MNNRFPVSDEYSTNYSISTAPQNADLPQCLAVDVPAAAPSASRILFLLGAWRLWCSRFSGWREPRVSSVIPTCLPLAQTETETGGAGRASLLRSCLVFFASLSIDTCRQGRQVNAENSFVRSFVVSRSSLQFISVM